MAQERPLRNERARGAGASAARAGPCATTPAFKRYFSLATVVEDLLRAFAAPDWAESLDFSTLSDASSEFIDETLHARCGDMVWRVCFHHGTLADGTRRYLFVLLEFQSSVDAHMQGRMRRYTDALLERLMHNGVEAREGELPPVLPVVPLQRQRARGPRKARRRPGGQRPAMPRRCPTGSAVRWRASGRRRTIWWTSPSGAAGAGRRRTGSALGRGCSMRARPRSCWSGCARRWLGARGWAKSRCTGHCTRGRASGGAG